MTPRRTRSRAQAGFTLFEALVAIALMGLVVGALATVTAQWVPGWRRGLERVQANEQVAIALDRITADLAAAEYVPANRESPWPLFEGEEMGVVFVRTALGPNTAPGLEIVRIVETVDDLGWVLVRQRAPFAPAGLGRPPLASVAFADPVVLLRAPFRVAFAYTGQGEPWKGVWRGATSLPNAIRITVRDAIADRPLSVSTATRVRVDRAAPVPIQSDQESPVR